MLSFRQKRTQEKKIIKKKSLLLLEPYHYLFFMSSLTESLKVQLPSEPQQLIQFQNSNEENIQIYRHKFDASPSISFIA